MCSKFCSLIFIFNVNKAEFCSGVESSHPRCSLKKGFLRNFAKFTGKQLCQSLFFNKVAGLRPLLFLLLQASGRFFCLSPATF